MKELEVSKKFSQHLMEKSGLIGYAKKDTVTQIEIIYDAKTGDGIMNVFSEVIGAANQTDQPAPRNSLENPSQDNLCRMCIHHPQL